MFRKRIELNAIMVLLIFINTSVFQSKAQVQFEMQRWTGAWGSDGPINVGDLNGDGKTDVFMWRDAKKDWTVNLSTGSGFNMQSWTGAHGTTKAIYKGYLNNDRKTDVFFWDELEKVWRINLSTGTSFIKKIWPGAWGSDGPINVGDLNGDRITDVFMWRQSDNSWTVNLSTGTGFNMQRWTGAWGSDGPINVGDLNADGKTDVFMWRQSDNSWTVNLSTGTGFNMQRWTGAWGSDGPINVGDLNADGKTDVFMWRQSDNSWTVNLSTGSGFNMQRWTGAWGSDGPINVGDLNGDKKTDVFMWRKSDNSWTVNISTGTGFNMFRLTGAWGSDGPINVGDLNGDGKTDVFMWRGSDNSWTINLSTLAKSSTSNTNNPQSNIISNSTKLLVTNYNNGPIPIKDNCIGNTPVKWPSCYCGDGDDEFPFGSSFEWMPIPDANNFEEYNTYGLSGTTVLDKLAGSDLPFAHPFGYNFNKPQDPDFTDWESFILPDHQYINLLADANATSGEYLEAAKKADFLGLKDEKFVGTMGIEFDQGLIPSEYRSIQGDRTAVFGRLIVDCGHNDYHTEIHPPLLLVNARPLSSMMDSKKFINFNWVKPPNLNSATYVSIISRPFLVLENYKSTAFDNKTFKDALLAELAGIFWLPDYQMSLSPQIKSTPFEGTKVISFDVYPVSSKVNATDELWAQYHFTTRTGVAVAVLNKVDHLTILITMNSSLYNQDPSKSSNRFLRPHSWILSHEVIKKLSESYYNWIGGVITGASVLGQFQVAKSLAKGFLLTAYENPEPKSPIIDNNVFNLNNSGQQFEISDDQAYPVYGWMAVGWVPSLKPTDIPFISPCATNYDPKTSYRPIKLESTDGSFDFSATKNTKTFRITNSGVGTVRISKIMLAGINANSFKLKIPPVLATNGEIILAPGESHLFTVNYIPGGEGTSEATIEVVTDIFKECPYKFPISGFILR